MYKSLASLVKFIPKYFILFDAIINGIVFLISFLDCSLLVCRKNTIEFCKVLHLILYPATLQNSTTGSSSSGFFSGFLRIFYKQDHVMYK